MDERDLDWDVEQFNPEKSIERYKTLGYTGPHIKALVALDKMIYMMPHEEIRQQVRDQRALSDDKS